MQSTSRERSTRRRNRIAKVLALTLLLAPLLTGCLRAQVSIGVSADDRVSGQIVAATIPTSDTDTGPQLVAPSTLASKIRIQEYRQDGYVGTEARFNDLSFGDVQTLGQMSEQATGSYQLVLQRAGDTVTLDGKADLQNVPAQGTDVQFTIAFPARIGTTNGTREGDNIITWKLPAGEVTSMRAEVNYPDPNTRSFAGWAGIVGGVTVGIAAIVGAMAWVTRNPPVRRAPSSV
ncbi:LppM family (lipo)protein [Rhodococcus sp. NPDC057297]|uniref:LppM family (lipo)protein n=1 Tax=Rhodococcus sp. NPDC057297 TaxID=3346090 RepID=UPI0036420422